MRPFVARSWLLLLLTRSTLAYLTPNADSKIAKNVLESKGEGYCSPSGPIENTLCAYETVEGLNNDLFPALHDLVQGDFFRHYKVDLFRECPFWHENGFCMNRDCGVETADESEIPEKWRAKTLSQVHIDGDGSLPGCDLHSQDFCYTDSESSSEGSYVDLVLNPERFTGYAGASAHRVWSAIYEENCFGLSEKFEMGGSAGTGGLLNGNSGLAIQEGFGQLKKGREEECVEKRIYYRIISGLHASISVHICHDYLDQSTGEWHPNLQCFITRLASHPERLSNIYFNTVLLLRAIARAEPYLRAYDIETAKSATDIEGIQGDRVAKKEMDTVLDLAKMSGMKAFDEKALFRGPDATQLREDFKHNFRNVSRILDCVGCDKCRLWGKLQVSGLGTALKILFELDDKAFNPKINPNLLQRSEIVALFNTLHRMSESLDAIETFRRMYAEAQKADLQRLEESRHHSASTPSAKTTARRRRMKKTADRNLLDEFYYQFSEFKRECQHSIASCFRHVEGPLGVILDVVWSTVALVTSWLNTRGNDKVEL